MLVQQVRCAEHRQQEASCKHASGTVLPIAAGTKALDEEVASDKQRQRGGQHQKQHIQIKVSVFGSTR